MSDLEKFEVFEATLVIYQCPLNSFDSALHTHKGFELHGLQDLKVFEVSEHGIELRHYFLWLLFCFG